jgi:hypothetical protein
LSHTPGSKGPMPYGDRSPSPSEACAPEGDREVLGIYNLETDPSVPIGPRHRAECLRPRQKAASVPLPTLPPVARGKPAGANARIKAH